MRDELIAQQCARTNNKQSGDDNQTRRAGVSEQGCYVEVRDQLSVLLGVWKCVNPTRQNEPSPSSHSSQRAVPVGA